MGRTRARATQATPGFTLDAGALIAIERRDERILALLERASERGGVVFAVPVPVLAQVWRGSARQAQLARFLALPEVEIVACDAPSARAAGVLYGAAGTADVVDAFVVVCARERGHRVVTSDAGDLALLDPSLEVVAL